MKVESHLIEAEKGLTKVIKTIQKKIRNKVPKE